VKFEEINRPGNENEHPDGDAQIDGELEQDYCANKNASDEELLRAPDEYPRN
jgi:hypothetical protein